MFSKININFNLITYFLGKQNVRHLIQSTESFIEKEHRITQQQQSSFIEVSSNVEYFPDSIFDKNEGRYKMELVEVKLDPFTIHALHDNTNFIAAEQETNRLVRFIWAFLIVMLSSVGCFLCVKGSIDWATNSQTELNKMKDAQLRAISEEINAKYAYIRTD
jgi:hypothetical protein